MRYERKTLDRETPFDSIILFAISTPTYQERSRFASQSAPVTGMHAKRGVREQSTPERVILPALFPDWLSLFLQWVRRTNPIDWLARGGTSA